MTRPARGAVCPTPGHTSRHDDGSQLCAHYQHQRYNHDCCVELPAGHLSSPMCEGSVIDEAPRHIYDDENVNQKGRRRV